MQITYQSQWQLNIFFLNWGIKEIERAVTIKIKWLEEVSQ